MRRLLWLCLALILVTPMVAEAAYTTSSNTTGTADASGNMTLTLPASINANDIITIGYSIDNGSPGTITMPSGFTQLSTTGTASLDGQAGVIGYKRAAGTEGSTTITMKASLAGSAKYAAAAVVNNGRDTGTNPAAATVATSSASNPSVVNCNANGVTASSGDDLVYWCMPDLNTCTDAWSVGAPSGYTIRQNVQSSCGVIGAATQDNVGAGATGTVTGTITRTSGTGNSGWIAHLIRIPAAAGGAAPKILLPYPSPLNSGPTY